MRQAPKLRTIKTGQLAWSVRDDIDVLDSMFIIEQPDDCLRAADRPLRNDSLITLARIPGNSGSYVLRRLNYGRWRHRLRDIFRPSRARRAFVHGLMLETAGVRTPRAIAAAEVRRWRWPIKAYVLTDEVPNSTALVFFLAKNDSRRRQVILATADLIADLHNAGFSHRDLKQGNILIDGNDSPQPWLIDLDGVRYYGKLSISRAVADLAVLARDYSRTSNRLRWEGARFLRRYCERRHLQKEFRELAREIVAESRRR